MKRLSIFASLILVLGFTMGCDDDDDSNDVIVEAAPPTPSLTDPVLSTPAVEITLAGNTFTSPCLSIGVLDMTSSNRLIAFDAAGSFAKRDDFFLGSSCGESPYLTLETEGTFVDGGQPADAQAAKTIDYTVADTFLTIHSESLLITFNANAYCGKSDWKIEDRVSLKGINCEFLSSAIGSTVADIYKIEENTLYFGNNLSFDAKVGAPRPTDVNREINYRIQAL